jgi:hypothetical protein
VHLAHLSNQSFRAEDFDKKYEIPQAFCDEEQVVKLVKSVYFNYMATTIGGFAEYAFDQFAFEFPLGLKMTEKLSRWPRKLFWMDWQVGKGSSTTFRSHSTWIVRLSALLWHMMESCTRAIPRAIADKDSCFTVLVVSSSPLKCY